MDKTEDVARYIIQNAAQKDKDRKYERETDSVPDRRER